MRVGQRLLASPCTRKLPVATLLLCQIAVPNGIRSARAMSQQEYYRVHTATTACAHITTRMRQGWRPSTGGRARLMLTASIRTLIQWALAFTVAACGATRMGV